MVLSQCAGAGCGSSGSSYRNSKRNINKVHLPGINSSNINSNSSFHSAKSQFNSVETINNAGNKERKVMKNVYTFLQTRNKNQKISEENKQKVLASVKNFKNQSNK